MSSFDKITESLRKPRYIDFVNMRTGERHRHDQGDFEVSIPSAGDTIYINDISRYPMKVKECIWDDDVLTIRVG